MMLALPDEGVELSDTVGNGSVLDAVAGFDAEGVCVDLRLPKLSCETTVDDLAASLVRAGFATAGTPNLTPMTGMGKALASYVHGAKIAIDEDGWIVEDEEIPGVCRITLEEEGHAPYAITCGVFGLMAHTAFAGGYDETKRRGTKHFAPGTRVYMYPIQWGDGWEREFGHPHPGRKSGAPSE